MSAAQRDYLILAGIVGAVMLGAFLVVHVPNGRKLEAIRSEMVSQQAKLDGEAQSVAMVPQIARQVEQMKVKYQDFDRRLPKQKELGLFLRQISENLAGERLASQVIEPGSPVAQDLFHTLPITMRFRGPYLSLAQFLQRINRMERLARVQKLIIQVDPRSLVAGPDGKTAGPADVLDITLNMNIYFTES